MGLGWLRLVLSLMVMDAHFEGFRHYLQPWIINRLGIERLSYLGEGGVAVTGFFVISGYVIAYVLGRKYDTTHWRGMGTFYLGRLLRIFPLYLLLFAAYWSLLSSFDRLPAMTPPQVIGNLLLLPYGLHTLFADPNVSSPPWTLMLIGPSWTLTLDLLLYLVAPFLFTRKSTTWGVWWLGLGYFLIFALYSDAPFPVWFAYFYPSAPPYIFAFATGALLYHHREWPTPGPWWTGMAVVSLLVLTYCPFGLTNTTLNQLFAVAALAVLLAQWSKRQAQQRWDRLCGDLTYATYLLHLPLYTLVQLLGVAYPALVALVTTYGLAVILLYGFEYPLDRLRDCLYHRGGAARCSGSINAGLSRTVPGLALAAWLAACVWGIAFNLVGARYASRLNLDACASPWRCQAQAYAAELQIAGAGQAALSFVPLLPPTSRIAFNIGNQGKQGEVLAGFDILLGEGQKTLRVDLLRQDNQCHLLIAEPGRDTLRDPWGWSPDCRLVHGFLLDNFTGLLAVDFPLWVYHTAVRGEVRLRVVANESGQGKVTVRDVFVGGH
jgi:peptidoglycan/LPS O-acetylase OafA/YrhL